VDEQVQKTHLEPYKYLGAYANVDRPGPRNFVLKPEKELILKR